MPKKLIGFRLDEAGEAKLNLLVAGARSREEWFPRRHEGKGGAPCAYQRTCHR